MEALAVTLKTAKKLKAAVFPQETQFFWVITSTTPYHLSWYEGDLPTVLRERNDCYAAPTAQEIADQLPTLLDGELGTYSLTVHISPAGTGWQACYSLNSKSPHHHWLDVLERADGDTISEALAQLYLRPHEVGDAAKQTFR